MRSTNPGASGPRGGALTQPSNTPIAFATMSATSNTRWSVRRCAKLQCDTQRYEADRLCEPRTLPRVELRKPEHQRGARSEAIELVAVLDRNLDRMPRKGEPDHEQYQPNADRAQCAP